MAQCAVSWSRHLESRLGLCQERDGKATKPYGCGAATTAWQPWRPVEHPWAQCGCSIWVPTFTTTQNGHLGGRGPWVPPEPLPHDGNDVLPVRAMMISVLADRVRGDGGRRRSKPWLSGQQATARPTTRIASGAGVVSTPGTPMMLLHAGRPCWSERADWTTNCAPISMPHVKRLLRRLARRRKSRFLGSRCWPNAGSAKRVSLCGTTC